MAIQNGIPATLTVEDTDGATARDIAADVGDLAITTPVALQDVTGLGHEAMNRLATLIDSTLTLNGFVNPDADRAHDIFKSPAGRRTSREVVFGVGGQTFTGEYLFTDYAVTRAANGELTFSAPASLTGGAAPTWS